MKNTRWTDDLYLYRMKPAPPKKEDFQDYIALYCAEKDEKYLGWFFHYYEPRLNTIIMQTVQETAMQGHFADLKQAYIRHLQGAAKVRYFHRRSVPHFQRIPCQK